MMVSVNTEDLALVVELACLTESRTNEEQKALLAVAERCDRKRNAKVSSNVVPAKGAMWAWLRESERKGDNPDDWLVRITGASLLEREVDATRRIEDQRDRRIKPSWERKKR